VNWAGNLFFVALYGLLGSGWILRGRIWGKSPVRRPVLLAAFWLKILAGSAYGLVYFHGYQTGDIVRYFQDSQVIYGTLFQHPRHYFEMVFGFSASGRVPDHLLYIDDQLWLNWRTQEFLSVRINSLFNLFSFGHFYGNVVLLCLFSLLGLTWLHRALAESFPRHAGVLALAVFFMPSTLFWCSAVHKDAVTLFALGALLYSTKKLVLNPRFRHMVLFGLGSFLLWNCRSYMVLLLLPNLAIYAWSLRNPGPHVLRFALMHALLLGSLLPLSRISPAFDVLGRLRAEQEYLLNLKGITHLPIRPIGDSPAALLANLPMALDHVWLKTFTNPPTNAFQVVAAISGASLAPNLRARPGFLPLFQLRGLAGRRPYCPGSGRHCALQIGRSAPRFCCGAGGQSTYPLAALAARLVTAPGEPDPRPGSLIQARAA
jgi:hypothetical protein